MNVAIAFECRHRAAQPVRVFRRKAGADNGDLHRLLLKERHPQGLAQHFPQCVGRVVDGLSARAAAQIGMHHVALDRPRPHDRDRDDEIVKFLRLEPRQHRHLSAALDLEDAE